MFAYIPARGGSKRIPKKNIRPLGDKPLIAHVIENLKPLDFIKTIYVSTDDDEIADIATSYGATTLGMRDPKLADHVSGFADLIRHDIPRFVQAENGDDNVLFALATAALVPTSIFKAAYHTYLSTQPEILMSCEPYQHPIWWAMQPKEDGYVYPLYPDKVAINSQDLPTAYTDSGLFYFFSQSVMSQYKVHKLAKRLQMYDVPYIFRGDINDEADWEHLEWKYNKLHKS